MTRIVTADIGGTHARFAIAEIAGGKVVSLGEPTKLACADYASFQTVWEAFGEQLGEALPRAAAIAIAAPVTGDLIKMTNNPWVFRPALVNAKLGLDRHILLNDFAAVAHAVDAVGPEHLAHVAGPKAAMPDDGIVSVIGPGTGLGVAILARIGGRGHVFATEGGHIGFAPLDRIEDRILARLRAEHGRVSAERVVAGPGLRVIFQTLAEIECRAMPQGDDTALWTMALTAENSLAEAALDRFCQCLGAVAGDLALSHGPGPVVLAGGLGLRLADILPQSGFAERFAAKGRYHQLMERQTVSIITHPEPGLFGAAAAFAKEHT